MKVKDLFNNYISPIGVFLHLTLRPLRLLSVHFAVKNLVQSRESGVVSRSMRYHELTKSVGFFCHGNMDGTESLSELVLNWDGSENRLIEPYKI